MLSAFNAPAIIQKPSEAFVGNLPLCRFTSLCYSGWLQMSIVTKTGDAGKTALMYGRRVLKNHPRVEAE
jgi:hypothetical protein